MNFADAVKYYRKGFGNLKGKAVLVTFNPENDQAYFSIAPLSRAVHELGGTINCMGTDEHSDLLQSLLSIWTLNEIKDTEVTDATISLRRFISAANKKLGNGSMEKILKRPDIMLMAENDHFSGSMKLDFKSGWHIKRKESTLKKTCDIIWNQVYNLKQKERVGVGFETIPAKIKKPLQDYLDSFAIAWGMKEAASRITPDVTMSASTSKESMLVYMERIGDLKATLLGCELSKDSPEPIFKAFKKLSQHIKTNKIKFHTANFFISGEGYPGKHRLGYEVGYPTLNLNSKWGKSRWQSPGGIIYQLSYAPQTKDDVRGPKARIAFTSTIPYEIFLKTCNINWLDMKKKNDRLARIFRKSERFIVKSNVSGKYATDFEVGMVRDDGTHRVVKNSDIETRRIVNSKHLKKTNVKAGNAGNIPAGEVFVTPEYLKGTVVGDVVINIDDSYRLSKSNPFVIKATGNNYKVIKAPKKLHDIFKKRTTEARKLLNKSKKILPKHIYEMKLNNFWNIGEYAINTNPKAKLCDYLIVNEKIANMIHVALGSGFEDDRSTEYHYDMVIDAPGQKLDITGIDSKGKEYPVMKKGKLVKYLRN